ncbi:MULTISPECIES: histidine phosphatase family protein [Mesorhizobium]|uniref:histidine phosphatase family protein n=1 Tax=Mesorhizobium TaxID=68287 RepID=UPI001FDFBC41|nr:MULTISPECIES: histidine phosphatase family protein [Mesorhizobium]
MPDLPKPLVYFVRHGQTDWNAEGRFQGQNEVDLNAIGHMQAERNGRLLRDLISHPETVDFVASPMRRTVETMQIVRREMGLDVDDFRTDPRLVEVHFGDWQGQRLADLKGSAPDMFRRRRADKWNMVPPGEGGESYQMLLTRMRPWFDSISQPTVCVAHGGILRAIFRLASGVSESEAADLAIPQDRVLRLENGALNWL